MTAGLWLLVGDWWLVTAGLSLLACYWRGPRYLQTDMAAGRNGYIQIWLQTDYDDGQKWQRTDMAASGDGQTDYDDGQKWLQTDMAARVDGQTDYDDGQNGYRQIWLQGLMDRQILRNT